VDEEALLSTALPESIRQVVVRRLGRLLPTERELLEWAAVVGQVFWEGTVMHIAPLPRERVQEGLRRLVERGLIIEHEPASFAGEREYVFENATLQHVAYERIPTALRPRCHLWVAEWLTHQDERRVEEYAELIASHYEQAGRVMKAADWYIRAGKHARSAFAPLAAIRYFRRALDYLPSLEDASAGEVAQQFTLYDGLVEVLRWQGRFAGALEAAQHMRAAAERMEDAKARARAHRDLALVYDRLGEYTVALEHADRAESIARTAGEVAQLELSNALAMKGWIYYRLGEAESALKAGHKALETCMALGARREVALSLNLLGALYDMLGNYEAAVRYGEASLEAFRELGDRHLVGSALNNLGENARLRGDYAAAVAYYEESLEVARQTGARSLEILALNNLGGARVGLGKYEAAERDLRQVIEVEEGAGWFLSETYRFLARACLEQGKLEQALAAARQALERGLEGGNQEFTGAAWRSLGRVAARRGEEVCVDVEGEQSTYDAPACFAESLRIFEESGMEGERGRTLQAWAAYELEQGDRARGEAMQREAQSLFERLGIVNG
jgi:tetratricopeptide (TPR) repeat protein